MGLSPKSNYEKKNVSCFDIREVPRSPGKWNWNWLYFLPFIFTFEQGDSSISALFISDRQLPFSQRCALNGRLPRRVSPVQSGEEPHIAHEWPPRRWIWSPGGWRLRRPASRCDRGTWSHSIYFRTVSAKLLFCSG